MGFGIEASGSTWAPVVYDVCGGEVGGGYTLQLKGIIRR